MVIMSQAFSTQKSIVDGTCIVLHTPPTVTCLGVGMMVSQSVLLSLTYRGKTLLEPTARCSKLIAVVVRDGMLVFGVVIGKFNLSLLLVQYCDNSIRAPTRYGGDNLPRPSIQSGHRQCFIAVSVLVDALWLIYNFISIVDGSRWYPPF